MEGKDIIRHDSLEDAILKLNLDGVNNDYDVNENGLLIKIVHSTEGGNSKTGRSIELVNPLVMITRNVVGKCIKKKDAVDYIFVRNVDSIETIERFIEGKKISLHDDGTNKYLWCKVESASIALMNDTYLIYDDKVGLRSCHEKTFLENYNFNMGGE